MKNIVIDLKTVATTGIVALFITVLVALLGITCGAWHFWPETVVKVETVTDYSGEKVIRMECRGEHGCFARLFGYTEEATNFFHLKDGDWIEVMYDSGEEHLDRLFQDWTLVNRFTKEDTTPKIEVTTESEEAAELPMVDHAWDLEDRLKVTGLDCQVYVRRPAGKAPYYLVHYHSREPLDLDNDPVHVWPSSWNHNDILYFWVKRD